MNSVGGQSTYSQNIDFKSFSRSSGFKRYYLIKNKKNIDNIIKNFLKVKKLAFLEVKVGNNKIKKLPRPKNLIKIKDYFMKP